ncbi:ThuA domain-containing protein [Cohnella herbarum]|uniref:Carbohydrate-binding protein n=1 Tax=Cohnella herbarum TaxID=2728023 RepID=A0A7Z2ZP68_9BACL|nr:ThuA domain-containing protein [Cohnella herbarum]QJD87038.1 carbohydrate-binding protein [Cohnella herbarum]
MPRRTKWLLGALAFAVILLIGGGYYLINPEKKTGNGGEDGNRSKNVSVDAKPVAAPEKYKVLLFTKTQAFRHDSIGPGIAAIKKLAGENNFEVDATEDATKFNAANLGQYAAVIFLNTTGEILNEEQQAAFQAYIQEENGYVGIHSASDTLHSWAWYMNLVGGMFTDHPEFAPGTVKVADKVHPSTVGLPSVWQRSEEWYNFLANPRGKVHVLATADEKSYKGGKMGNDHPIAWCQKYDGGRSWYTGLGHAKESYENDPSFLRHILGGIQWAAGKADGDCSATVYNDTNYKKQELMTNLQAPMGLDFAPDGRMFFIEIDGKVKVYSPKTELATIAATLKVVDGNEQGLLGIALDPDFENNNWIYLYYSPVGSDNEDRISRFEAKGDTIDLATEKVVLRVPNQREECCHHGGDLEFGSDGNLYLSTGDNTNPFASDGYAPIDETPGRSAWDAQLTAGNKNDLRGKIIRIKPEKDGTYSIPKGNLFTDGSGKPEIYVMGTRNPFRMAISPYDNTLYWGDVGPDAGANNVARGPKGYDEINKAVVAGNYGWPHFIADNKPYMDYDFVTHSIGELFDASAPKNDSPNNTGGKDLPPAQSAMIYYPYGPSAEYPEMTDGTGRTAAAAAVYRYDENNANVFKLPAYLDKSLIIFDFSRQWFKEVRFDEKGELLKINPFLTNLKFDHPIYGKIGPDGNLYVIEYGTGGSDGKISKVAYNGAAGNQAPNAKAVADATNGLAPLAVKFSTDGTVDTAGDPMTYAWDFDGDGKVDSAEANPSFIYDKNGNYNAKVTVTDRKDNATSVIIPITVGNRAPVVTITAPAERGFFAWGDTIAYTVKVIDAEDKSIDCSKVQVTPALGHDEHSHPGATRTGCTGSFQTTTSDTSIENTFYYITASYTDNGTNDAAPLMGSSTIVVLSKDRQAEYYEDSSGGKLQTEDTSDVGAGRNLGFIENASWIAYKKMNLANITGIQARVSSAGSGGTIEMRTDSPTGKLLATLEIPVTGDWQKWVDVAGEIKAAPTGLHDIYFAFNGGDGWLFNVNRFDFIGNGIVAVK